MPSVLEVTYQENHQSGNSDEDVFECSQELDDVSKDQIESRFNAFKNNQISCGQRTDVYVTVWPDLGIPAKGQTIRLSQRSILAERLSDRIEERNPSFIECTNLTPPIEAMVLDVANHHDIPTNASRQISRFDYLKRFFASLFALILFLFDQLFSMFWKHIVDLPQDTDVVFAAGVGRFDSVEPVIQSAQFDSEVVIFPMTLSYLTRRDEFSAVVEYNPTPLSLFANFSTIIKQTKIIYEVFKIFVTKKSLESDITAELEQETGIVLRNTTACAVFKNLDGDLLRSFLYRPLAEQMIETWSPDGIVVNGLTYVGRTILSAGNIHGVNLYHVPHSITKGLNSGAPYDTITFMPSELERKESLEKEWFENDSEFVVTGRPYLEHMKNKAQERLQEEPKRETDEINIMLATQPIADYLRFEFVSQILKATENLPTNITIKTHPGESPIFYRNHFPDKNLTITDSNLVDELVAADLVLTVSSNVGIEAILFEAASVYFNPWFDRTNIFVENPRIPRLETKKEVEEFFQDLSKQDIPELQTEQTNYIRTEYVLEDTADNISDYIQTDISTRRTT